MEKVHTYNVQDELGESFTRFTILDAPNMSDSEIDDRVARSFPPERCQHEYDCCGRFYAGQAYWSRPSKHSSFIVVMQVHIYNC